MIESAIECVRLAAEAKSIRLQSVAILSWPILGDANRLQQVVWNLLSNALKFTPKDGRVEISLQRVNSHVEITVSDTGTASVLTFYRLSSIASASTTARPLAVMGGWV